MLGVWGAPPPSRPAEGAPHTAQWELAPNNWLGCRHQQAFTPLSFPGMPLRGNWVFQQPTFESGSCRMALCNTSCPLFHLSVYQCKRQIPNYVDAELHALKFSSLLSKVADHNHTVISIIAS